MNGLNDFAENTELREGLRKEFPASLVSKLPATAKRPSLDYVGHAPVTDRLNREAPGWTYELTRFIEFTDANGLQHVMAVYGYMQIGSVKRWEVGEADGLAEYGRELKGAISDFIRRAAMRFGVALDLWSKEDLHNYGVAPASAAPTGSPVAEPNAGQGFVTSPRDGEGAEATTPDVASPSLSVVDPGGEITDTAAPETVATRSGEGATPISGAASTYLTKDEQKQLVLDYGSNKAAKEAYQKRFGERIQRIADITREMVEAMNG